MLVHHEKYSKANRKENAFLFLSTILFHHKLAKTVADGHQNRRGKRVIWSVPRKNIMQFCFHNYNTPIFECLILILFFKFHFNMVMVLKLKSFSKLSMVIIMPHF